jgi:alkaline phosphatase
MVGDGMGLSSTMATRSYLSDVSRQLAFEKFPHTGMSKVYCVNYQVPDSACTATAFLTGIKNNFSVLGLTADVTLRNCTASKNRDFHVDSIFKHAQDAGKSTGIVTTTRVTHATPAAAYATSASRHWEGNERTPTGCSDIAHQLIHGKVGRKLEVVLGGGRRYFEPTSEGGRRTDGRNLFNEFMDIQRQNRQRAAVVFARDHLNAIEANRTDRLFGVFSDSHMEYKLLANEQLQPTLTEMTAKALEMLQKNRRSGYVLLVEGGRIDTSHHQNRAKLALEEVAEFEKAVEYVVNNTNEMETLVVVTADHSHPFTVGGYLVGILVYF